jgi:hypothetical protein
MHHSDQDTEAQINAYILVHMMDTCKSDSNIPLGYKLMSAVVYLLPDGIDQVKEAAMTLQPSSQG